MCGHLMICAHLPMGDETSWSFILLFDSHSSSKGVQEKNILIFKRKKVRYYRPCLNILTSAAFSISALAPLSRYRYINRYIVFLL